MSRIYGCAGLRSSRVVFSIIMVSTLLVGTLSVISPLQTDLSQMHQQAEMTTAPTHVWYDDCNSTEGWINQDNDSDFKSTYFSDNISLSSESGYIYADSLPTVEDYYSGATFVKELETPITISQILMFEVEFEWIYESDRLGYMHVYLFDDNKSLSVYQRARDSWAANVFRPESRYYPLEGDVAILDQEESTSWRGFTRFWHDSSSHSLQGEIDDGSTNIATLKESGHFDPERVIKYIGICPSRRNDYAYNDANLRIHGIRLEYMSNTTAQTTTQTTGAQTSIVTETSLPSTPVILPNTSSTTISTSTTDRTTTFTIIVTLPNTSSSTIDGNSTFQISDIMIIISYTITIGSGVVIVIFIVLIIKNKQP